MLNRRESSKIKFHPPRLIRKHSRYKFNLLLERDEVVIGGFGFSVERYEKLTANRDDWRRIARAPVNRVTSTKDGKVGGGWEDEEEKKRRGGSGFKVVVVVAGWWEWHGGKESRAVAAKSAHSAALLDRLWNINLQHYRPEERTFPPSSPLLLGLYATSSTPETSSNNLEPLGMDFEFLDTPSTPHSPSDSPTTRLPIYSSRWKNHRCDAFYSTLSMERTRSSRFRFQRILTRRIFIPISSVSVLLYVRMYVIVSRYRGYVREPTLSRIKRKDYCRRVGGKLRREDTKNIRCGYKITKEWPRVSSSPFDRKKLKLKEYFKSRENPFKTNDRFVRSINSTIFSIIKQIGCFFLSIPIHQPLTLSRSWTITGEEEFSRETLGHTFLSNSLFPDNWNDPKSLRNEWEKSRDWPIREGLKLGTKSGVFRKTGVVEGQDRSLALINAISCTGIAQIHPSSSPPPRALSLYPHLDPAWKPQLTNGRLRPADLCRFPWTSFQTRPPGNNKLPDRAFYLINIPELRSTHDPAKNSAKCRQTCASTELSLRRNCETCDFSAPASIDSGLTD